MKSILLHPDVYYFTCLDSANLSSPRGLPGDVVTIYSPLSGFICNPQLGVTSYCNRLEIDDTSRLFLGEFVCNNV